MFAVVTALIFAVVCVPFLAAVKEEASALYESWGSPTVFGYIWNRSVLMPFSGIVLRHEYAKLLAPYPRSRAWASWLFIAHWLQMIGLVVFVLAIFGVWQ